ncbi:hypothetical protein HDV00_001864 [Rhizophlyctis rosea]|nr:hypothetical protein HDV00_001864 [Rhizophlyctis rosea]
MEKSANEESKVAEAENTEDGTALAGGQKTPKRAQTPKKKNAKTSNTPLRTCTSVKCKANPNCLNHLGAEKWLAEGA